MYNSNGPPKGFNVTSDQSSYDLVSKDIIICSGLGTPNPDKTVYTFNIGTDNMSKIYKAEVVSATIPFNSDINANVKNQTLLLSIPQMNQNTFRVASNTQGSSGSGTNVTQGAIFCQIPDNYTPLAISGVTSNTISLFIGARMFDTVQYYNPPLNKLNHIDVSWYSPNGVGIPVDSSGASGTINQYYFTLRIYYFQKRNNVSAFSTSVFTYGATGTLDSIFEPFQS
jgi:hypothetical protein